MYTKLDDNGNETMGTSVGDACTFQTVQKGVIRIQTIPEKRQDVWNFSRVQAMHSYIKEVLIAWFEKRMITH